MSRRIATNASAAARHFAQMTGRKAQIYKGLRSFRLPEKLHAQRR
jgi:hypothetical protein